MRFCKHTKIDKAKMLPPLSHLCRYVYIYIMRFYKYIITKEGKYFAFLSHLSIYITRFGIYI